MAIWIEDLEGNYIQTLYVAQSVATGIFRYGIVENGKWTRGPRRNPQTLPYWAHKRGVQASDGLYVPDESTQIVDAYTGATPTSSFVLNTLSDNILPKSYKVLLEINQNWDWNNFWKNNKYPDDEYYKRSCQPALIYEAVISADSNGKSKYEMKVVGHSHYSGKDGNIYTDLSTFTTALEIIESVVVTVE